MPKTVLIILAAVVALIVIVVLTGMRYLRADDEDDFDDDVPAEHGGSRSRGSQPRADRARSRHADDLADERPRERVGATRGARPGQGRDELGTDRRGLDQRGLDQRGTDQRGSSRTGQDRSWREDSSITSRGRRTAPPAKDQRPARTPRREHDDISEPAPAARSTRSSARGRGGDDYDNLPGRRASSQDYDREPPDRRASRDGLDKATGYEDDLSGRRDGRDPRDRRDRGDTRPGRDSRDRTDLRDNRPAASIMDDADADERDRRSNTRPNARANPSKNGSKPEEDLLPAVKPRQSKNKRESEGDWPSNEWDELSDVDYWAELASDKPFTGPSSDEAPRSERRDRPRG